MRCWYDKMPDKINSIVDNNKTYFSLTTAIQEAKKVYLVLKKSIDYDKPQQQFLISKPS